MSIKKIVICFVACLILLCGFVGYLIYEMNCTHGVYEINISAVCVSNNSVGNEWFKTFTMDGKAFSSSDMVIAPIESETKILTATITEKDKYSDSASKDILIPLKNNTVKMTKITVVEQGGRFDSNTAEWEIKISVKLIKKIMS